MKCPACGEKAIGFIDWSKGTRWWRTRCDACQAELSASVTTLTGVAVSVALAALCTWLTPRVMDLGSIWMDISIVGFTVACIGLAATWFIGGYVKKT